MGESSSNLRVDWKGIAWSIIIVIATTAVGWPLYHTLHLANTNILMLYLVGVLWIATHHSQAAAIVTSLAGVLAFDFIFVPPYYHLTVDDPWYLVTFAVMLATALTISTLTHQMRLREKEAREAWERVEVEFLRNTLLSGVSHELRTPLAAITGASSALIEAGDQLTPEAKAEMLDTVYTESERMERLINNLLDITRMESGGLVLKKEPQAIDAVVGSALHRLERRLRGRQIITAVSPNLPLVEIDPIAAEQLIVNLVDNAIEYTPEGKQGDRNRRPRGRRQGDRRHRRSRPRPAARHRIARLRKILPHPPPRKPPRHRLGTGDRPRYRSNARRPNHRHESPRWRSAFPLHAAGSDRVSNGNFLRIGREKSGTRATCHPEVP